MQPSPPPTPPRTLLEKLSAAFSGEAGPSISTNSSDLFQGAIWAFVTTAAGMGLGLLTQKMLANELGPTGFGLYLYVVGWSNVAGLICTLEIANAAVRFVSSYTATASWGLLRGFLKRSQQIVVGVTSLVAVVGAILLLTTNVWDEERRLCMLAICALFPTASLLQLQSGFLLGWKRVRESQVPFQVIRPALFAIIIFVMYHWLGAGFTTVDAVLGQLVTTAVALMVTMRLVRKAAPAPMRLAEPVFHTSEWIRTSAHFGAISVAQLVLSTQADLLFVGTILGKDSVGLYGAAAQFAVLVGFGSSAVMVIAQPMIADLYARADITSLNRLVREIMVLTFVVTFPVFLAVLVLGHVLLGLYGEPFVAAYPVLVILAGSQLIAATIGSLVGYLFTMTNRQVTATKIIGSSALLNIVLALILTYRFGIVGTAVATLVSTLVRSGALGYAAKPILSGTASSTG